MFQNFPKISTECLNLYPQTLSDMKTTRFISAFFAALSLCVTVLSCAGNGEGEEGGSRRERRALRRARKEQVEVQNDTVYPLGFLTDTLDMQSGSVRSGDLFGTLVQRLGLPADKNLELQQACGDVFNPARIVSGTKYDAYYTADSLSRLQYIVYHDSQLISTVFQCFDSLSVWKVEKEVERVRRVADVTINSSLIGDMLAAGYSTSAAYKLADIFAWTVDFFGLQKGDRFRMIYDELQCEGETMGVDTVFFALCDHDGKEFPAIMYDQGDGGNLYWNPEGQSMKKAFLKAPLNFTRISSGYTTHRLHPVTRKVQPHLAVDYAAPTGTPVWSIGDGVVISAGYSGASGNMVKIRHNNGEYQTAYLHLSKYGPGIKAGVRVRQGQVIGYVGSTGRSTGPHLDFRVWKNGTPVNPLKLDSPPDTPINKENLPVLDSLYRYYRAQLD